MRFIELLRVVVVLGALVAETSALPRLSSEFAGAPTQFTEEIDLHHTMESLSLRPRSLGSHLSTQTLSVRGSAPAETAVFLEGIRLNSQASGDFDFSLLSPLGLRSATLLKGPHIVWAPDAAGSLHFSLPEKDSFEAVIGLGSFGEKTFSLSSPMASASLERSDGDYEFNDGGRRQKREHNAAQRFNARLWKRGEFSTIVQFLQSDQDSPGSLEMPSPHARLETFQPLLALSFRRSQWWLSAQFQYQNQIFQNPDYSSESLNQWILSSASATQSLHLATNIHVDTSFTWEASHLWSRQNSSFSGRQKWQSPLRHSLSLHQVYRWSPLQALLIQPMVKAEFISDLHKEQIFPHASLGARYQALPPLAFLSNVSYGSRAPNFNEMYFEEAPFIEANRQLRRQKNLSFDLGFEWKKPELIRFQESFFIQRRLALLQDDPSTSIYKILNRGTALNTGFETSLTVTPHETVNFHFAYVWQSARLNNRAADYQATHALIAEPSLRLWERRFFSRFEIAAPFSYRSPVRAGEDLSSHRPHRLNHQIKADVRASYSWSLWSLHLSVENLGGWSLQEVRGYPLAAEPSFKGSLAAQF